MYSVFSLHKLDWMGNLLEAIILRKHTFKCNLLPIFSLISSSYCYPTDDSAQLHPPSYTGTQKFLNMGWVWLFTFVYCRIFNCFSFATFSHIIRNMRTDGRVLGSQSNRMINSIWKIRMWSGGSLIAQEKPLKLSHSLSKASDNLFWEIISKLYQDYQ